MLGEEQYSFVTHHNWTYSSTTKETTAAHISELSAGYMTKKVLEIVVQIVVHDITEPFADFTNENYESVWMQI